MTIADAAASTAPKLSAAELAEYLTDLGGALLSYGCPTHRLEALVSAIATLEGYRADAFAVPTGLFMSLSGGDAAQPLVRMVRVADWGTDLERLALIDRIFNDVLARKLTLAQGRRMLDVVESKPPAYPAPVRWLALAAGAGASAVFFRGGWLEIAIAAFGGLLVGLIKAALGRSRSAALLTDFAGGVIAAGLAWAATALVPQVARETLVLSVVILLVPGMALTNGLAELVHKNLVSGAAKLMEAMMTFVSIILGIAVMVTVERLLKLGTAAPPLPLDPPLWMQAGALTITAAAFCVIFSVPRRLMAAAMVSGALGWITTYLGVKYLPGSLAAFAAALAVATYANAVARVTNRPAQIFLLPGMVLLVPGSFGFVSLESFLHGDFLNGAAKGFEMFLTAGAIVTGIVVANVILPARKLL